MGTEVAIRSGAGTVVIDARRGDGPPKAIHYTCPALIVSEVLIQHQPEVVAAGVRAIVKTQRALAADQSLATKVGQKLFPAHEASLIAELIRRDLPFYDPSISREFVAGMTDF